MEPLKLVKLFLHRSLQNAQSDPWKVKYWILHKLPKKTLFLIVPTVILKTYYELDLQKDEVQSWTLKWTTAILVLFAGMFLWSTKFRKEPEPLSEVIQILTNLLTTILCCVGVLIVWFCFVLYTICLNTQVGLKIAFPSSNKINIKLSSYSKDTE